MTQPVAHVIAHPTSTVLKDCVRSLERHGWTYTVVAATQGNTVTDRTWTDIGVELRTTGKMLGRPGAQGCWISHYRLWRKCVDTDLPITILEHDALVQAPWPADLPNTQNLVKLYSTAECKQHPVYGLWSKGAHAYTITPQQAAQLIQHSLAHGAEAVDKHLGSHVLDWCFYTQDLVVLNPGRGASTTSRCSLI